MAKYIFLLLTVVCFNTLGFTQDSNALFEQGKQQYKTQNYTEAITQWEKIISQGQHSSALYFNLGNANYKLNNIAQSIYYYEKALQLNPNDKEVKNNLAFAKNATIDLIEPLPKTFFEKWNQQITALLSYNGWAWATVIFVSAFCLFFILYYFAITTLKKRSFFVGSMVSLFVTLFSFYMSFKVFNTQNKQSFAIVFAKETQIKSAPIMGSETTFLLHEGAKVALLEKEDNWAKIKLEDGKEGWILLSDIKKL